MCGEVWKTVWVSVLGCGGGEGRGIGGVGEGKERCGGCEEVWGNVWESVGKCVGEVRGEVRGVWGKVKGDVGM